MKKLNNKGMTLIELIVSFALVSVAVIYFYQTLTTVYKLYKETYLKTNDYVNWNYAFRVADKMIDDPNYADGDIPGIDSFTCTDETDYYEISDGTTTKYLFK